MLSNLEQQYNNELDYKYNIGVSVLQVFFFSCVIWCTCPTEEPVVLKATLLSLCGCSSLPVSQSQEPDITCAGSQIKRREFLLIS